METWKRHPEHDLLISTLGGVVNTRTGFTLNPSRRPDGYLIIHGFCERKLTRRVHRLVLETFVGPCPEGHTARHLDGTTDNNRLRNLAWGTNADQEEDKKRHGTFVPPPLKVGKENPAYKYDGETFRRVTGLTAEGKSQREISRITGVSKTQVARIQKGRRSSPKG